MKTIYFAGGCFWGAEKYLSLIPGVVSTECGYANGHTENPTYEDVCQRDTGHAETVKVVFDPMKISLGFLLDRFYDAIDPTTLNRQGGDIGTQYRTGVYYTHQSDKAIALGSLASVQKRHTLPIVVEVLPLENYYAAEEYHQKYLEKNPDGYCHIDGILFDRARNAVDESTLRPCLKVPSTD
jgi:methionine-S-sulfoxide reductase